MQKKGLLIFFFIVFLLFLPPKSHAEIKHIYVHAYDFVPHQDRPTYDYWWVCESGYLRVKDGSPGDQFYAQLNLPDGVIITKIGMRIWDNGAPVPYMEVFRKNMFTEEGEEQGMCHIDTHHQNMAAWQTVEESNISKRTIHNGGYTYYVRLNLGNDGQNIKFAGLKITYIEGE